MSTHRIVLDYGHGGSKPGAVYGGVEEKTVNLLLGQVCAERLRKAGFKVLLTRDGDYDVPLGVRCRLVNAQHEASPIALVLSLHHNAAASPQAQGFEAYYLEGSQEGARAAQAIVAAAQVAPVPVHGTGLVTTAQLGRELAIIHKTTPPAVLVEVGYLTSPVDRANAVAPAFRSRVAEALTQGVQEFIATISA